MVEWETVGKNGVRPLSFKGERSARRGELSMQLQIWA